MQNLKGSFENGSLSYSWEFPEYTVEDHVNCSKHEHLKSRRQVVKGYIQYFTPIERWYCACGRVCWVKFDGYFQTPDESEFGGHISWIMGAQRNQKF